MPPELLYTLEVTFIDKIMKLCLGHGPSLKHNYSVLFNVHHN